MSPAAESLTEHHIYSPDATGFIKAVRVRCFLLEVPTVAAAYARAYQVGIA